MENVDLTIHKTGEKENKVKRTGGHHVIISIN